MRRACMAAPKKQQINLLPQEEFAGSTVGRILKWILSTFRMIVVITEVVVMGAFLSRFYLDARISDLNRQIKDQQTIITSFKDFEGVFRGTQQKIQIATSLIDSQKKVLSEITDITSLTPPDVILFSFSFIGSDASVRALTPSEFSISQYIANLKGSEKFGKIELTQISTAETTGDLNFSIDIGSKDGGVN